MSFFCLFERKTIPTASLVEGWLKINILGLRVKTYLSLKVAIAVTNLIQLLIKLT